MIVASLLLVIAAAVTLLIGLLNRETLEWVYASIAFCLLAGLLLTIGVLRSRPSRKPVLQSGGEGQGASWAGAASQWGGAGGDGSGGTDVLTRDEDETDTPELVGDDDPTRTSLTTDATDTPADDAAAQWAPPAADTTTGDDAGDVRVVPPPGAEGDAEPTVAGQGDTEREEDVVVVPKPSARGDAGGPAEDQPDVGTGEAETAASAPGASGEVAAGRGPATPTSTEDAARFEQVLSPIAGVGPTKRAALLEHFGTYRKLRAASPEKLAEVPGVSRTLADRIHNALHK